MNNSPVIFGILSSICTGALPKARDIVLGRVTGTVLDLLQKNFTEKVFTEKVFFFANFTEKVLKKVLC